MQNKWIWPLPGCEMNLHAYPHPGGFGTERKYDIHCGMDIYCNPGQEVVAVEDGVIVAIENFTGDSAEPATPWWNNTRAVLIEGESGVVVYGEIAPDENIAVPGLSVRAGDIIGTVITVLKKDKGLPMTMLHLELHKPGTIKTIIWDLDTPQPDSLLNPTMKLVFLK